MGQSTTLQASQSTILLNKIKTFFSKPHNVILLLMGIVLTFSTVAPIVAIVEDTFKILLYTGEHEIQHLQQCAFSGCIVPYNNGQRIDLYMKSIECLKIIYFQPA